jgi:hypothetical protein
VGRQPELGLVSQLRPLRIDDFDFQGSLSMPTRLASVGLPSRYRSVSAVII